MMQTTFPQISDEKRLQLLQAPTGRVRVVIDTDAKNEIDDQFALAWAFWSQEQLKIEGVYATPFSFQYRIEEIARAWAVRHDEQLGDADRELMQRYAAQVQRLEKSGLQPEALTQPGPDVGMEQSYQEILVVLEKLGVPSDGMAFRGSDRYLTSLSNPIRSPAVEHLIARALAEPDPLYVIAIGCATNVASALLLAPEIIENIVVIWTSGYPTSVSQPNYSFNLEQDMLASQLMFDSGVPLVYLPGFHIGAQLRLSLPEMEAWVKGRGAMGDYLYWLYTHNPLYDLFGIDGHFGRTWVIWDLINIAWLLNPGWVPTDLLPAPVLTSDKKWQHSQNRHLMREAYEIDRDAIFRDFFTKLERAR